MSVLAWIAVGVVLLFVYLIFLGMRAGPRQLDSMQLAREVRLLMKVNGSGTRMEAASRMTTTSMPPSVAG